MNHPSYNLAAQNATGAYHIDRWTYDQAKWAVLSPGGVTLSIWDSKKQAKADCERRIHEAANIASDNRPGLA